MLGDAVVAQKMSERLLELDIFAIGQNSRTDSHCTDRPVDAKELP